MSDETARRAQEVLEEALGRSDSERAAYLAEACGDDAALQAEVHSLLAALDDATSFLETPAVALPDSASPETIIGARLGQYTIESVIASGGMGTVYLAQQEQPRRRVAVKVLRGGLTSKTAQRRFEYESHILARLRHPNIAQIHDAGTQVAKDGAEPVPYFVMEFIADAQPITKHADTHGLSVNDRLRLFAKVCDAVHHGHQNGIIHRDIKPANILVNAEGEPKVIDFGIARIDEGETPGGTLVTGEGQILGTLQYMSPEQCSGRPDTVDTRTDVYSLGVVLYELLCGKPPYEVGTTVFEAARVVREKAPDKPSVDHAELSGDLETIILTALAKEPERRYHSAGSLASDIRRFLACTPISARPRSTLYEVRLFAKRNRAVVAAAALAMLALVAGTVTSLAFGIRASREAEVRRAAEEEAQHEASIAGAVNTFLTGVLQQANPKANPEGRELTLRESLEIAADVIPEDQPEVAGTIHSMLGANFRELGALERSEEHLRQAEQLLDEALGPHAPETMMAMNELGLTLIEARRLDEAIAQLEPLVARARPLKGDDRAVLMNVLNNLALAHLNRNDPASAEPVLREAIEVGSELYGREHPEVATMLHNMGGVYYMQGELEQADEALTEALELRRKVVGNVHPDIPQSLSAVVLIRRQRGLLEGVEGMLREGVEIRRELYGESHPLLARSINNLASFLLLQERYDEALPATEEALTMFKATLPAAHPDIFVGLNNYGHALEGTGRLEEAEQHYLEAWSMLDEMPSATDRQRQRSASFLQGLYESWDKPEQAAHWKDVGDQLEAD